MWFVFLLVILAAVLIIVIGWRALLQKLPRQRWAGIRTPYSLENDEQWYAVHRYGAPYLIFGGVAAFSMALALFPFSVAGKLPTGFAAAALVAIAVILSLAGVMAWVLGVRGAKASLGH